MVVREQSYPVTADDDVVRVRRYAREWANELRFGLVDQTKLVTAASELARNAVIYGGGGTMRLRALNEGSRAGLRIIFEDHGPGIPDLQLAMKDAGK